jgi:hypothetical protein
MRSTLSTCNNLLYLLHRLSTNMAVGLHVGQSGQWKSMYMMELPVAYGMVLTRVPKEKVNIYIFSLSKTSHSVAASSRTLTVAVVCWKQPHHYLNPIPHTYPTSVQLSNFLLQERWYLSRPHYDRRNEWH